MTTVRERDYDEARSTPIRAKISGEWYEYAPEAPIDVAIEWMDRQTRTAEELGESVSEYMLANYRTVLGAAQFEDMRKNGAGSKQIDDLYRDLLDWWGLWVRPDAEPNEIDDLLDELEALIVRNVVDEPRRMAMGAITAKIRAAAAALQPEETADAETEEETAGNPA